MEQDPDIYVLDTDSMLRLWLTDKVASGKMTERQAAEFWNNYTRQGSRYLATYFATASDLALLTKLAADLGTPLGRVYFKSYGGKMHVVFKGYPGLRNILTAPKYGVTNAKVVGLGIGEKGVKQAMRKGGILSVILITAWNVVDYVLNDQATLGGLIGQTATDISKIAVSTFIGSAAGAAAVGTVIGTFALGPLIVAVAVGVGVALVLDWLDNKFGWTEKLKKALDDKIAEVNQAIAEKKEDIKQGIVETAADLVEGLIDVAVESARRQVIREFNKWFRRIPVPRL